MNNKVCVYKNCGNTSQTTDVTFFTFPFKDERKCESWVKLAGCEGINLKYKYLCENHFSSIYISRTSRRTILLPPAMPYRWDDDDVHKANFDGESSVTCESYCSDQHDKTDDELLDDQLGVEEEVEFATDPLSEQCAAGNILIDTTTNKIHEYSNRKAAGKVFTIKNDGPSVVCHVTKRARLQPLSAGVPITATLPLKPIAQHRSIDKSAADEDDPAVVDYTENNADITTFIFKGEEYIQMPKHIYLQQRAKLDADIRRYEKILRSVKSLVQSVE